MTERIRELLEEGLRHHVLGDDEMAAECFSKILAEDPTNEKAIRLLGMVRRPRGATTESQGAVAPTRAAAMPQRAPRKEAEEDPEIAAWMKTVEELFSLGDFSGSLAYVEKVLAKDPHHPQAQDYLARNRRTLTQFYESKLGSVYARPRVVVGPEEILWLNIDHRGGFLLSQIDGSLTVDDLYALSGMGRMETAKILAELLEAGVIEMT
ncbi:MAG TPA: hypothetical protein VKY51_07350 [Fredinandcohnia sp.]|nr:hypothetical protein [Fredinandcohnia sp.]